MRCEERKLDAVGGAKLIKNVRQVAFHRVFGDGEGVRDLLVGMPGHDRTDNCQLTLRQTKAPPMAALDLEPAQARSSIWHLIAVDPVTASCDAVDAFEEHLGGTLIQDQAPGAESQCSRDIGAFKVFCENDRPHGGVRRGNLSQRVERARSIGRKMKEQDVGLPLAH